MTQTATVLDEIRQFAKERRLTPSGFAKLVGMGPNALSDMFEESWNPKWHTISRLQGYMRQSQSETQEERTTDANTR